MPNTNRISAVPGLVYIALLPSPADQPLIRVMSVLDVDRERSLVLMRRETGEVSWSPWFALEDWLSSLEDFTTWTPGSLNPETLEEQTLAQAVAHYKEVASL